MITFSGAAPQQRQMRLKRKRCGSNVVESWKGRRACAGGAEEFMRILLLLPYIGLLWVPFYNFSEPSLFGFPFFYWYQLAWVPISSLLIWLVYRSRTPDETP
jgi:Protein of unknown function (DUF3311)